VIQVVNAKDCAIANHHFAAGIRSHLASIWLWLCTCTSSAGLKPTAGASHAYRVTMKLVDRRAYLSESLSQLLFLLTFDRNLHEGNNAHREDRHDRNRNHQLDQREPAGISGH